MLKQLYNKELKKCHIGTPLLYNLSMTIRTLLLITGLSEMGPRAMVHPVSSSSNNAESNYHHRKPISHALWSHYWRNRTEGPWPLNYPWGPWYIHHAFTLDQVYSVLSTFHGESLPWFPIVLLLGTSHTLTAIRRSTIQRLFETRWVPPFLTNWFGIIILVQRSTCRIPLCSP